jgi:hypothetical protein
MTSKDAPARKAGSAGNDGPTLPPWLNLGADERILFHELPSRGARLPSYALSAGLFEIWRRRTHFIVTTRRLIAVRGLVSRDQQVIPLDRVHDVTIRRGPLSATVWVETVGGALGTQPLGPLGSEQAEVFLEATRGALAQARGREDGRKA